MEQFMKKLLEYIIYNCYYSQYYSKYIWIEDGIIWIDQDFSDWASMTRTDDGSFELIKIEKSLHTFTGINKLKFSDKPHVLYKWVESMGCYVGIDMGLPELCGVSWNN